MNNNQWYNNRDKRTDGCSHVSGAYKDSGVQVIVTDTITSLRVQMMAYLSVSMLARWCRNITITVADTPCVIKGAAGASLALFLSEHIRTIDPFCHVSPTAHSERHGDIRIFIGPSPTDEQGQYVSINGGAWLSCCAYNQSSQFVSGESELDILGTGFAASLGNSVVFRYLNGQREQPFCKWYSLLTNEVFDHLPQQLAPEPKGTIDLGRVHLVGCGAIGSSFAFLLPFLPLAATMLLVDPDRIEDHNTSSSLLFNYWNAGEKTLKTQCVRDHLTSYGMDAVTFCDDYQQLPYKYDNSDLHCPDMILCFANENNIWGTIQYQYPPVCFHATTSKSWGLHVGRHIPLKENCLMCTFQDVIDTSYVPICGQVSLEPNGGATERSHTAILPFLAPAAAITTLSEIIKLMLGQFGHESTTIFNMRSADGSFLKDYAPFGSCFICSKQTSIYSGVGAFSKFWHLSKE